MKIDKQKALDLKIDHNLSYQQIADMQGCSKAGVYYALHDIIPTEQDVKDIQLYKNYEADIFAGLRPKILAKLNDQVLNRMLEKHSGAAVMLLNSLFNNERLLRGESTSNVAEFHKAIQLLKRMDDAPDSDTGPELVIDAEVVK